MKHDEAERVQAPEATQDNDPVGQVSALASREPPTKTRIDAHKRWTQAQIDDLRLRLTAGASVAEIATVTDRTPASVSVIMGQLRLRAASST